MTKLILASSSLGRKKLLEYLKIPFEIMPSNLDEDNIIGKSPIETIKLRSRLKAESVARAVSLRGTNGVSKSYLVLAADSGAIIDNQLIGKPKDKKEAIQILSLLSGKTHEFITAVNIIKLQSNISKTILETTDKSLVTFRKITKEEIENYLRLTDYTRFAGSYALISAQNFITKVEGSLSNVIGLPLEIVLPTLKKYLINENKVQPRADY